MARRFWNVRDLDFFIDRLIDDTYFIWKVGNSPEHIRLVMPTFNFDRYMHRAYNLIETLESEEDFYTMFSLSNELIEEYIQYRLKRNKL